MQIKRMLLLFLAPLAAVQAQTIDAFTTESPPYQSNQFGLPGGYAVEIVKELARRNGDEIRFHFLPWARTWALALNTPDSLIFCLSQQDSTAAHFAWLGGIADNNVALWQLKSRSDIHLRSLTDARRYRVGVVRYDFKTHYLQAKGFSEGRELQDGPDDLTNLRKLLAGRTDLLAASNSAGLINLARVNGFNPSLLKIALMLPEISSPLGIAFSPNSNSARIVRYVHTLDSMRHDGFIEKQKILLDLTSSSAETAD